MPTQERSGYEIFAVTADKGIRAWAPDLPGVFRQAAQALWSLIVEPGTVRRERRLPVQVEAGDRETLLVAWLNELLFLYETQAFVAADCTVQDLDETGLAGEIWGERVDRTRHSLVGHVKAVTYHGLSLSLTAGGWEARVVVDV